MASAKRDAKTELVGRLGFLFAGEVAKLIEGPMLCVTYAGGRGVGVSLRSLRMSEDARVTWYRDALRRVIGCLIFDAIASGLLTEDVASNLLRSLVNIIRLHDHEGNPIWLKDYRSFSEGIDSDAEEKHVNQIGAADLQALVDRFLDGEDPSSDGLSAEAGDGKAETEDDQN